MDKKLIKIMIIIWSFIAVILTAFLIFSVKNNNSGRYIFRISNKNELQSKVQKEESISLDNCKDINLNFPSNDIEIYKADDDKLRIIERSSLELKDSEKFTVSKDTNTININGGTSRINFFIFGFGSLGEKIQVYIPVSYDKNLQIKSSSGDVSFDSDMALDSILCTQSSGDFNIRSTITSKKFTLKTSSGDIDIENLLAASYQINSTSGYINIKTLSGSGDVAASSGDIKINYNDISYYANISASSGDINLSIPSSLSFEFNGKCSSGEINSNFDMNYKNKNGNEAIAKVGDGPYKKISVKTNSGDIDIYNK